MKAYRILSITLVGLLLASCASSPARSDLPAIIPPTETTPLPSNNSSGNSASQINTPDFSEVSPPAAEANSFVRLVEEDLANRLQIHIDKIHFLKISDIDWQDIAQGCTAESSQTNTKGRVSGYRIWLEANGENYLYHIGLDNKIVFCNR